MCEGKSRAGSRLRLLVERISIVASPELVFDQLYRHSSHAFWLDGADLSRFAFLGDASGPLARVARADVWSGTVGITSATGEHTIASGFFDWLQ
ncbi:MAG TPA: hypothetical protein VFT95_21015, partial [Micromonosporaceae bacterium]|nr:hypothetical protein [Micromonosporaceae bacterium]